MFRPDSLLTEACTVLRTASPEEKVRLTQLISTHWRTKTLDLGEACHPPDLPARPMSPQLMRPGAMPKRRGAGLKASIALLHAIAHIELNAIDLAWDLIARFNDEEWPREFYDDWVNVADDESRHFCLLAGRLRALGSSYGSLPAHSGMWDTATRTTDNILARLATVPLVLEARALDVTPTMVEKFAGGGDHVSANILASIAREEISHVAAGWRWFQWCCNKRKKNPEAVYRATVLQYDMAPLKPPFNATARRAAGLRPSLYEQLSFATPPSSGD